MHNSLWDWNRKVILAQFALDNFPSHRAALKRRIYLLVLLGVSFAFLARMAFSQAPDKAYEQTVLSIQQQLESGNLDAAKAQITSASAKYPNNGGLENLLGIVEVQQGSPEKARADFNAAIRHSPRLLSAYLNLSRLDMQSAATDDAQRSEVIRLCGEALRLDATNNEAHYDLANVYVWQKSYQRSLTHLGKLSASAGSQIGAETIRCTDEAALGHRDETTAAASSMAANSELTEQDAAACLPALRDAHRADLIERLYAASARLHPLSANGERILGLAQEAEGKESEARVTLEQAFALKPDVSLLVDLTRVAEAAGDHQGALGYLAHAREMEPGNAAYAYEFGVISVRMGLFAEARKSIAEALRLEPDNPQYNLSMGIVVSFSEDPSQATPYLERYRALRPKDTEGMLALGTAAYRAKDYDTASKWLQQAIANRETAPDAYFYLGRIARQEGRIEEATADLTRSLALRPDYPGALAELGQIHLSDPDPAQAEREFQRALQGDPDNYLANYGLLQLYARTKDPRREQQSKRFEEVRNLKDQYDRQMMRVIEIHPDGSSNQPQ
jgi:tetratricopeptide (TPR) repeat protein